MVVLNFFVISANAQLPYSESFKNAKATNLLVSGIPGAAFLTSGSVDPAAQGYLRLTNNQNNQSGFVRSTRSFPSLDGLSITFDYFTYGGTGADGISFFLYDSSVGTFNIGAFGGSLGYVQNASLPGVSKGFIALGLDEFGNFSNPNAGRQGGPGRRLSSVLLRGDGNGLGTGTPTGSNYEYLAGISTTNTAEMSSAGAGSIFQIAGGVDGRTVLTGLGPLNTGYRRAKIDLVPNVGRTGFILNVWITEGSFSGAIVHHVIKNYSYIPTSSIPANLSYGFSAGTGSASNFHEIRNLEIVKPVDPLTVPVISNVSAEGIQNVELIFKSSDFISNFSHPSSRSLVKIKVQNLPLYGVLKLNGTVVTPGQEINLAEISQLRFIPDSDFTGSSSFQWNGSDGVSYAIADAFVNLKILSLNPTLPYIESFKNASAAGLVMGGNLNAAELTSGRIDATGAGYLRLTSNQVGQTGYVYNTKDFPSDKGLSVSFDYYGHSGSGSDGINFFLYDAAANPFNIGATGGAMGYAQSYTSNGLSKGFIGLSIDEYGNFSSPGAGRQGGPGRNAGSVTLRGDGDGNTLIPSNYEFLTYIQTNNAVNMSAVGAGTPFQLSGNTNGRVGGISGLDSLKTGFRRIKMDLVPNGLGSGYMLNVWLAEGDPAGAIIHHIIKDFQYLPTDPIPANFRFGFSASTGIATTVYEIRNLEILLPSNVDHKPVLNKINKSGYEDLALSFQLSDFTKSFFDPKGLNTLRNVEFKNLPSINEGILKLDGTAVNSTQLISVSDISAGKLSFIPALNYSGSVSSLKWNGHTTTNKAIVDEDVTISISPVNDAPLGMNKEVLIKVNDSGYSFIEPDFGFSDPTDNNLHTFLGVKIVNLPGSGTLKLNNVSISAGQFIPVEALRGSQFKFIPGLNETGKPYTSFTFQVKDNGGSDNGGNDLSQTTYTFIINVAPIPLILLEKPNLSTCVGSSSADFKYTSLSGDPLPNIYSIDWDVAANIAGLIDITDKDLLPGIITVQNLSNLTVGIYNGLLMVRNKNNNILSVAKPISITIKPLLRAEISYGAGIYCAYGKTMVSLNGDAGGRFTSSEGLIIDQLTGEVNLAESAPGNYTVSYSLSNDACTLIATVPLIVKAMPIISAITGSNNVIAGSSIQLGSTTAGGKWRSSNVEVLGVSSSGLATGLKKGEVKVFYIVKTEGCIDSVSFVMNVSQAKASDLPKIMNENRILVFSSEEFYGLIDSVSKSKDSSRAILSSIRIESLPSNGELKLNGLPVTLAKGLLFKDISELTYIPYKDFNGTDFFTWNWAGISGKYGMLAANVRIAVTPNSRLILKTVNENEVFRDKTNTSGRKNFTIIGPDASFVEINSSNGEFSIKSRDFESPKDANSNNIYEFAINSLDNNGNSYIENWRIVVQNVREYSKLEFDKVSDTEIPENSKYLVLIPKLKGSPIGKISYSLVGKDSILFNLDTLTSIVSMEGKSFSNASDSDKDNVYEIGLKATDSDQNMSLVYWNVKIIKTQEVVAFTVQAIENVLINEKMLYTSSLPVLNGKPVGKILYSLLGKDSKLFTINELNGIVSMQSRDFDFPLDHDKNNVYEVGLIAKDSDGTQAVSEWKVIIKMLQPSAIQSMLISDIISMPINRNASQLLAVISKYPNGERYTKGGEQVIIKKVSGNATISTITDLKDGTYTALVYPGDSAGKSVFIATLGGKEIMNGTSEIAKSIIEFGISNDNQLSGLDLSSGILSPQFKADVFEYSAIVEYSVDSINIIPSLNDPNAKAEVNGINIQKVGSLRVPLLVGKNLATVIVTAADGLSKQRYKINIDRSEAVFPYQESFMSNVAEGLVFGGNPNQAKLTSGTEDISGMGYLRLTNNKPKESGFVFNSKKIPSEKGLTISFEYFSHGGSTGDGLSFFLFDANANFKIGAFNGSLGYAQNLAQAGLNKGFLGLGLDENGEFSSTSENKQGGPGRRSGSVVLRGDGNGEGNSRDNYEYLTGIQTTDEIAMKLVGAGSKFQIFGNQNGRTAAGGALDEDETGYRKFKMQILPNDNKTGFIVNVWITEGAKVAGIVHHVIKNYSYMPTKAIPANLKYGFAANSGISANSYEIRNLEITIPKASQILPKQPLIEPINISNDNQATNLITPNGDGINDTWIVRNIESFGNNSLRIFNRFGQEVYRKSNYMNDWDGTKDGYPLPSGTYYYIFENSISKLPLKGFISILRVNGI